MNPTESFIVTHFNEVVSLIIAAALGWAGKAFYATNHELKGNGTGTNLYERMEALPLREDHTA